MLGRSRLRVRYKARYGVLSCHAMARESEDLVKK